MDNLFDKNRKRLDEIHADKRFPFLDSIYQQLLNGNDIITDEEIIYNYFKFSDQIQTNTISGAELEWVTISIICFYRKHLTSLLIRRGLLYIVYSLGDEIDTSDIFAFINYQILAEGIEPYGGLPPVVGLCWLKEVLPTQRLLVQQTLEDVIEQNRRELENM